MTSLSPILYLFQIPTSILYRKLQHILSAIVHQSVIETQRRPGPKDIPYGIPEDQWPIVLQRIDQGEMLRKVAGDYGVSYEALGVLFVQLGSSRKLGNFLVFCRSYLAIF